MKLSKPLLPAEFIKTIESDPMMNGFKSHIHSSDAHTERLQMRNWSKPRSPNWFTSRPDGAFGFVEAAKRTCVHFYAMESDILYLCELFRCGAIPDQEDVDGITPIYLTMQDMFCFFLPGSLMVNNRTGELYTAFERERDLLRCERVIRILVEQHADVNRTINDVSLLEFACTMKHWGIITLLLEHGAKMTISSSTIRKCFTHDEQARFFSLVKSKSLPANQERPPRICPCWSGKVIKDCHATKQPYPLKFVCVCGSGKIYEKCCLRKRLVVEKWDDKFQRIVHYYEGEVVPQPNDNEHRLKAHVMLADILTKEKLIDPAFAYALRRSTFIPTPSGRNLSRNIQENSQKQWNGFIDEYIASGTDKRSMFEIEKAAKISVWAGALIRTCEGVGCSKVERKDVAALKICAKCHITAYCSFDCQKSAWSTHKRICGTPDQKSQALPSQLAIDVPAIQNRLMSQATAELNNFLEMLKYSGA